MLTRAPRKAKLFRPNSNLALGSFSEHPLFLVLMLSLIDFGLRFFERSKVQFLRHSLNTFAKPLSPVALGMPKKRSK